MKVNNNDDDDVDNDDPCRDVLHSSTPIIRYCKVADI